MRQTIDQWLDYYQTLHHSKIDLSLDRIRLVAQDMGLIPLSIPSFLVAGTNGKGATVACLDALLRAQGYRTGRLTSPHLLRYNERIAIDDMPAEDAWIIQAFEAIEQQRGEVTLSFFEVNVLAALWIFQQQKVDVVVLEVGLGGRLDACNIVDADVSIITTVDLDHQAWLGETRDQIGREKAGIMRTGHPVVLADSTMPNTVLAYAQQVNAQVCQLGVDYSIVSTDAAWQLTHSGTTWMSLPIPHIPMNNAAAAMMALQCHPILNAPTTEQCRQVFDQLYVTGRCQHIHLNSDVLLDVAHNAQSATYLANYLQRYPVAGKTYAVFSVLADKDINAIVAPLLPEMDQWHYAPLAEVERAASVEQMAAALPSIAQQHGSIQDAFLSAQHEVKPQDRVVVFGSFYTVSAVLQELT